MQPTHQDPLYPEAPTSPASERHKDLATELARLSTLRHRSRKISSKSFQKTGRNRLTRAVDRTLDLIRRYLPPIHWAAARFLALLLYGYARAVRATSEIVLVGRYRWPDFPSGSVLAIWHGSARRWSWRLAPAGPACP